MSDEQALLKILTRVRGDIARAGLSVIYIGDGADSYLYTAGRTNRHLPELLIICPLVPQTAYGLMNAIDTAMPERLISGSMLDIGGEFPLKVLDAEDPRALEEYARIARQLYGNKVTVQQLVLPDLQGRYPPDCAPPYSRQPLLGPTVH